jgi:hypothetical protein
LGDLFFLKHGSKVWFDYKINIRIILIIHIYRSLFFRWKVSEINKQSHLGKQRQDHPRGIGKRVKGEEGIIRKKKSPPAYGILAAASSSLQTQLLITLSPDIHETTLPASRIPFANFLL